MIPARQLLLDSITRHYQTSSIAVLRMAGAGLDSSSLGDLVNFVAHAMSESHLVLV